MISLAGHVALVTGAGRGIGRAIALRLAGHGAAVAALARTASQVEAVAAEIRAANGTALAIPADLTDDEAVCTAVAAARRHLGTLSILVNNAGWGPPRVAAADTRVEDIDRMLRTNLRAPIILARLVLPDLRACGAGFIVNIASAFAHNPSRGEAVYAATKAGLISFSRALAAECAGSGIRVAALCPAHVDTDLVPPNRRVDRSRFLDPDDVAMAALDFVLDPPPADKVVIPLLAAGGARS